MEIAIVCVIIGNIIRAISFIIFVSSIINILYTIIKNKKDNKGDKVKMKEKIIKLLWIVLLSIVLCFIGGVIMDFYPIIWLPGKY